MPYTHYTFLKRIFKHNFYQNRDYTLSAKLTRNSFFIYN